MYDTAIITSKSPESAGTDTSSSGIPNIVVHVYDEAKKGKLSHKNFNKLFIRIYLHLLYSQERLYMSQRSDS